MYLIIWLFYYNLLTISVDIKKLIIVFMLLHISAITTELLKT